MDTGYLIQLTDDKISFAETRRWILAQTFFIHKLARYLRNELHIPLDGFSTDEEGLSWERERKTLYHPDSWAKNKGFGNKSARRQWFERKALISKNTQEVFKPIYDAMDKYNYLQLEFMLLRAVVLGYKNLHFETSYFLDDNQIYSVLSSQDPIIETGVYIKYSPWLSNEEMEELKKKAQSEYNRMFDIRKSEDKRKREDSPERVGKYYLPVEDGCIQLYDDNIEIFKNQFTLSKVFDAIADDLKEKESIVRNNYYKIQKRYYLPSVPDASDIPAL